ncbi:MAG: GNAT family protein [Longimicrobiales bacterium]
MLTFVQAVSESVLTLSVVVGGWIGLSRYRRGLNIKAAELLLEMEQEFRDLHPTLLGLELIRTYRKTYAVTLGRALARAPLTQDDERRLAEVDRTLRFLYLCTVLHSELRVEQSVLARSYYWYSQVVVHPSKRPELWAYVSENYPRLHEWLAVHEPCFDQYQATGRWFSGLARDRSSLARLGSAVAVWRHERRRRTGRYRSDVNPETRVIALETLQQVESHERLVQTLVGVLGPDFEGSMADWFGDRLRLKRLDVWRVFAARERVSGRLVGLCGYYSHHDDDPGRYWLGWLAATQLRCGFGSEMLRAITALVRGRGGAELWVYTGAGNEAARKFYEANGFEPQGQFKDLGLFQDAAEEDSITLSLHL